MGHGSHGLGGPVLAKPKNVRHRNVAAVRARREAARRAEDRELDRQYLGHPDPRRPRQVARLARMFASPPAMILVGVLAGGLGLTLAALAEGPTPIGVWALVATGVGALGYARWMLMSPFARSAEAGMSATERLETGRSMGDHMPEIVAEWPVPFHVCVRCRMMYEPGRWQGQCDVCEGALDCHHVESEDDRALVMAAIG